MIKRINRFVNAQVSQRFDAELYGRDEVWVRSGVGSGAAGDCEDIAIEKRIELVAAGFLKDRLVFAVVYLRTAGLHTVLVAMLSTGDVVLDSRYSPIIAWPKARYSWISIQSVADPMIWHATIQNSYTQ